MSGAAQYGLFDGPAPRLRTTPASAAFLDTLAGAMIEALSAADNPFALADALVLLPNRRAAFALMDAFAARLGGAALAPSIRPLGDLEDDIDVWGAEPIAFAIAPAMAPMRRRLELAALIRARDAASGGVDDPARALALADELCGVLDAAAAADAVHWEALSALVDDADLAQHWALCAQFLDIIARYWPARLAELGLSDPAMRRSDILRALAAHWRASPPNKPVIIAGSTGSVAATRLLMDVVAQLPRGVVVFPGLDVDLDEAAWTEIGEQHPQFALKSTLAALGVARADVAMLGAENEAGRARAALMREALAPAAQTADWLTRLDSAGGAAFVARGAEGVRLIEAAHEDEEAAAIALLLREALETPERSAALVTPDVNLARRVRAKLARFGVLPSVSFGEALRFSPAGQLLELICELALSPCEAVALAGLIKHPLTHLGEAPVLRAFEESALRGAKRRDSFERLAGYCETRDVRDVVARIETALRPVTVLMSDATISFERFADAGAGAFEALCAPGQAWIGVDGQGASALMREAIEHGAALGAMPARDAARALLGLIAGREIAPREGGEKRIAIWGALEARMQRRDLMILGGLNEGVWPASPKEDPFLSRGMRARLGLGAVDARIGLAAHDFAQLVGARDVVLTRALRRDGAPAVASRWLWRLETLAKCAGQYLARRDDALAWARALDAPAGARTAHIPRPTPPAHARLARISVTQVETLIRNPYAVFAARILGLKSLHAVGARASHSDRGEAIHKALERFDDGASVQTLLDLIEEEFIARGFDAARCHAERARLACAARAYVTWLGQRAGAARVVFRETTGKLALGEGRVLSAKADRIEVSAAGAAIVDFKSGAAPSKAQVACGLAPQLTLEAAMIARGAFDGVEGVRAHELIYWTFSGAEPKASLVDLSVGAYAAGEEALGRLEALLTRYADERQPFLCKPRVQFIKPYTEYDHLARRKEWADAEGAP